MVARLCRRHTVAPADTPVAQPCSKDKSDELGAIGVASLAGSLGDLDVIRGYTS